MQHSREGSGGGGRSHSRHRHHLQRILSPTARPTSPSTATAESATIMINPADVAIAVELVELFLLGERQSYGRSGGMAGGESAAITGEAKGGSIRRMGGGVAGGVEHRHYRRGRVQAWPEEESPDAYAFPSCNNCTLLNW